MILCCGEALIDMIPAPMTDGRDGFVPHPGGAVFNTAIALGRLSVRVGLLSGLSRDRFGGYLTEALSASHVDAALAVKSDRPTTLAFVHLVDGQASYSFFDENSAGRMLTLADMPTLPDDVTALFMGGISLACDPGADAYAALLAQEGAGRAVMLDPNIRPGFIRDADRYRARLAGMIAQADIVKLSDEDLDWIAPDPLSVREKIDAILDAGPAIVLLTRGAQGATGFLADGTEVQAPAETVEIKDTVGAGDTFNAGVLAKLSELNLLRKSDLRAISAEALQAAMTHGARVAAVTVRRAGANPPWAKEL